MGLHIPFVGMSVVFCEDPLCRASLALWIAGCSRSCAGCQNPELRDPATGTDESVEMICEMAGSVVEGDLVESVTYLGGDWMEHPEAYVHIAGWVRSKDLDNVLYTGEFFEDLPDEVKEFSDWVIDGPFDSRRLGVFPPSVNQHVFTHGELVDPEELPLYHHLLGMQVAWEN